MTTEIKTPPIHKQPTIENWELEPIWGSDGFWIIGNVYARPGFEDGTFIHTSRIQNIFFSADGEERAYTLNSVYALGEPK
jgi:hypothetical protein